MDQAGTCKHCGDDFTALKRQGPRPVYCSADCRNERNCRRKGPPAVQYATCGYCGGPNHRQAGALYCSAPCARKAGKAQERAKWMEAHCKRCDAAFERNDPERVYCSTACHREAKRDKFTKPPATRLRWSSCTCGALRVKPWRKNGAPKAMGRWTCPACSPGVREEARRKVKLREKRRADANRVWVVGLCARCGDAFVSRYAGIYCSRPCERRANNSRRDKVLRGAYVANVNRRLIFERDNWKCGLCRKAVRRTSVVPHPLAPTIDHIIPISRGGTHEPANVQCAHFRCNALKRDGVMEGGEQLRLLG